jgi:hypothetical protein
MPRIVVTRALRGGRYAARCGWETREQIFDDWFALVRLEATGTEVEWQGLAKPDGYEVALSSLRSDAD